MLHWLTGGCRVFGLDGQNWMVVIAGALAVYFAVLVVLRRRRHTH
jgi:hypothetical protein